MYQVIEAMVDESGQVFLAERVRTSVRRRALLVVLDERPAPTGLERVGPPPIPTEGNTRYRFTEQLGAGGMGETFLGVDASTGRVVCIKRLRPGIRDEIAEQEWRSLKRIDSPFVVRHLDRFDEGGAIHLVMEFVGGQSLADRMTTPLSTADTLWLALCLMRGLKAMHELEVIHCDLKPQNIIIRELTCMTEADPHWAPVIIDFGLAIVDRLDADGAVTRIGASAGTAAYMAPEQVVGLMLTPACDIYAVGLILWEVLAGRRAFPGNSYAIRAAKVAQQGVLPIEKPQRDLPTEFVKLVERCTHPVPVSRPSAAEALELMERLHHTGN